MSILYLLFGMINILSFRQKPPDSLFWCCLGINKKGAAQFAFSLVSSYNLTQLAVFNDAYDAFFGIRRIIIADQLAFEVIDDTVLFIDLKTGH